MHTSRKTKIATTTTYINLYIYIIYIYILLISKPWQSALAKSHEKNFERAKTTKNIARDQLCWRQKQHQQSGSLQTKLLQKGANYFARSWLVLLPYVSWPTLFLLVVVVVDFFLWNSHLAAKSLPHKPAYERACTEKSIEQVNFCFGIGRAFKWMSAKSLTDRYNAKI